MKSNICKKIVNVSKHHVSVLICVHVLLHLHKISVILTYNLLKGFTKWYPTGLEIQYWIFTPLILMTFVNIVKLRGKCTKTCKTILQQLLKHGYNNEKQIVLKSEFEIMDHAWCDLFGNTSFIVLWSNNEIISKYNFF